MINDVTLLFHGRYVHRMYNERRTDDVAWIEVHLDFATVEHPWLVVPIASVGFVLERGDSHCLIGVLFSPEGCMQVVERVEN